MQRPSPAGKPAGLILSLQDGLHSTLTPRYRFKSTNPFIRIVESVCKNIKVKLDNIIGDRPLELYDLEKTIFNSRKKRQIKIKYIISQIFDYDKWNHDTIKSDKVWNSFKLAKRLNINVCPYCNRQYISTVLIEKGKTEIRPAFDHFMPKAIHPLLSLSFYNLIPSCTTCNSNFKGQIDFLPETHLHPYEEGFSSDRSFCIRIHPFKRRSLSEIENNMVICFKSSKLLNPHKRKKCRANEKVFKLAKIYHEMHRDVAAEIFFKTKAYTSKYLDSLKANLQVSVSKSELARIVLGNYCKEEDWEKRPLAKMTHDIAKDLGWIF